MFDALEFEITVPHNFLAHRAWDEITTTPCSEHTNAACAIQFHVARLMNTLIKMAYNSRSNFGSH